MAEHLYTNMQIKKQTVVFTLEIQSKHKNKQEKMASSSYKIVFPLAFQKETLIRRMSQNFFSFMVKKRPSRHFPS